MKLHKIILMAGIVALGLTSCGDDDDWTRGAETGQYNVAFTAESQANQVLGISDTQFPLTLVRTDASQELTVPLNSKGTSALLKVPESVTFAAGSSTASITIGLDTAVKAFVNYPLVITIPEQYTHQYDSTGVYPRIQCTVHKEDWQYVGTGVYYNWLYESEWEQDLEHSDYLGIYRLPDCLADGYNIYFRWDGKAGQGQTFEVTNEEGTRNVAATLAGFSVGDYGACSWQWRPANFSGYTSGAFYFPFRWTVSAGSFGTGYDTFTIDMGIDEGDDDEDSDE